MPLNVSLYLNIWHIKKKESFQCVAGALKFPNNIYIYKKVKQSHYRPGVAQRVLRKLRFSDFVTTAQDGGKASLTHRPPLPPGNAAGTHFC